jgi:hypothetical protein
MPIAPEEFGDIPLEDIQRDAVLDKLLKTLDQYVFPDIADQLQADIQQRRQAAAYSAVTSSAQFADMLTLQLQTLASDRQLKVHFSPQPLPDLTPGELATPEALDQERDRSSQRNFDLNRVERLRGNIGYLELYGFEPPEFAGDTLAAAMTFLQHTQALILDVRYNRGGSPAMVALLCSYLLPAYPPLHLNNCYWRPEDSTRQWWTIPHLSAPRYEHAPVYILTSQETFSAAEEFAYDLQVLGRAIVVGEHTSGGAHPGQGYRLADHFWIFLPTGQSINPKTQTNWAGTGVIPQVKVPAELALLTAQVMALNTLIEGTADDRQFREWQQSLLGVERELNTRRADLISQLKQPS